MRKIICAFICLLIGNSLFAQHKPVVTIPLPVREVSGVVKDSTATGIEGATVKLVSNKDTMVFKTNVVGVFVFKNVKSAEFILTVGSFGFVTKSQKYLNNDTKQRLILKPIVLKTEHQLLNEVTIKGKVGPKYLKDTVEFWADDYIIREYAKLEDLLKKMEGVSVDVEGNVTHQGEKVERAKFNGVNYFGGNIKEAIKELPANIVQRIQVIDDYGGQAEATGIKTGESTKVLNVVSKADKSVGVMYGIVGESNFENRYFGSGSYRRIDGHDQRGINASFGRSPAGISETLGVGSISRSRIWQARSGSGMDGGKLNDMDGGFTYGDKISDKLDFQTNYVFRRSNANTSKSSLSEEYYDSGQVNGSRSSASEMLTNRHVLNGMLQYKPGKTGRLKIDAELGYSESKNLSESEFLQTGAINRIQRTTNNGQTKTPNYKAMVDYTHYLKKKGSSLSLKLNSSSKKDDEELSYINRVDHTDVGAGGAQDYELHNLRDLSRLTGNHMVEAMYAYPFSESFRMGLNGAVTLRDFNSQQLVRSIDEFGQTDEVDSLSHVFNYQTMETPLTLTFNYDKQTWYELSLGLKALGNYMRGSFKNLRNVIHRDAFNVMPNFTLALRANKRSEFKLGYAAMVQQPSFEQVLPILDVTDPLNTMFGNTDLKSSFTHRPSVSYNMYSPSSMLNFSLNFAAGFTNDKVTSSQFLIEDPQLGIRRETHYINSDGNYNLTSTYNVTKTFTDARYSVSLNGSFNYMNTISMSNGLRNTGTTMMTIQYVNLSMTPVHWLDINLGLRYRSNNTAFTLPGFLDINSSTTEFNANGRLYFTKKLVFNFDVGKTLVRGLSTNGNQNPFIINMNIEKRMFKKENGMLSLVLMDALKQNILVSRSLSANGYVDSQSNTNSRYFLLQFSWTPQHWGAGKNAGKARKRDGGFIDTVN